MEKPILNCKLAVEDCESNIEKLKFETSILKTGIWNLEIGNFILKGGR